MVLGILAWGNYAAAQEPVFRPRTTNSASHRPLNAQGSSRNAVRAQPTAASRGVPLMLAGEHEVIEGDAVIFEDGVVGGESVVLGEPYMEDHGMVYDGAVYGEHHGAYCSSCNSPRRLCICLPAHGWVHAEYLLWWQNGMNVPPLVSTSPVGTPRANAGILPAASTLFGGNDDAMDGTRAGGRIRFGTWFDRNPCWGLEGEYFGLGKQTESFFRQSTGTPILARPFFNIVTGREDAQLLAFPNVLSGSVDVDMTSQLHGAAGRLRRNLFSWEGCSYSRWCCTTVPSSSRLDATVGYRYYQLDETLRVRERITSLQSNAPGTFDITDQFDTRNQFNGGEIGFIWQGRRGFWSLDALMRVGIGNTHQTVTIRGDTAITENGVTTNFNNGILAQRTNIGTYDRNTFAMIPELGLTLGYQLTRCWRVTTGYSLIYWGNVVRPGDQVDRDVNPNLFAPETNPLTGALRPEFKFVSSDYWVQGLSFGGEFRW
jgi:hypothetical protein